MLLNGQHAGAQEPQRGVLAHPGCGRLLRCLQASSGLQREEAGEGCRLTFTTSLRNGQRCTTVSVDDLLTALVHVQAAVQERITERGLFAPPESDTNG